jgi:hypothetical protein
MSGGRFASMTASLLARKGDAQPSLVQDSSPLARVAGWTSFNPAPPPPPAHFEKPDSISSVPPTDMRIAERDAHERREEAERDLRLHGTQPKAKYAPSRQLETKAAEPAHIEKPRRLFVNITPAEYERLGIVAVKCDTTRHQLLREALEAFLGKASLEYDACACVGGRCQGICEA